MHQNQAILDNTSGGFTLLELLIVMVIGATVTLMAIPSIDYVGMRVNSTARQVGMTMLGAQRLAVLKQYNVVVAFDTANRMLRVHQDADNDGVIDPGEILNSVKLEDGVVFARGSAPAYAIGGADISFVKRQGAMPAITFNRSGAAGEAGGFYITSKRAITLTKYKKETRAFEVSRGTGRSMMYTYTGTAWIRSF